MVELSCGFRIFKLGLLIGGRGRDGPAEEHGAAPEELPQEQAYTSIRFVVTSSINAQQLQQILGEDAAMDPNKYRIDLVEFERLNNVEPEEQEVSVESEEQTEPEPLSGKVEEMVLSHMMSRAFTSREKIAEKFSEKGTMMSPRSVSRCLKIRNDKGSCGLRTRRASEEVTTPRYNLISIGCVSK